MPMHVLNSNISPQILQARKWKIITNPCIVILMFLHLTIIQGCVGKKLELGEPKISTSDHKEPPPYPLPQDYLNTAAALEELNAMLEIHLERGVPISLYRVKNIPNNTGVTGDLPNSISTMILDALAQLEPKIGRIAYYDSSDQIHHNLDKEIRGNSKLRQTSKTKNNVHSNVIYTIGGAISEFDRDLNTSSQSSLQISHNSPYYTRSDSKAANHTFSYLATSLNVLDPNGIYIQGQFGANAKPVYRKEGMGLDINIYNTNFNFTVESSVKHGIAQTLRKMCELSVIQIVGRTLNVPYWKLESIKDKFKKDAFVIDGLHKKYEKLVAQKLIIPYMQAQCIAHGNSLDITGRLDANTRNILKNLATRYGTGGLEPTNINLFEALEINRPSNIYLATTAWSAYDEFKKTKLRGKQISLADGKPSNSGQLR